MDLERQGDSDRTAPAPIPATRTKHAELSASLRAAIAAGRFKVGDKLPTETQFVESTPYSLGTIQRAIRTLVEEGLVERKPKLGTFVAKPRKMIDRPWHFRFLDADRKTPLPVYPTVVGRSLVRQRGPWSDYLDGQLLRIDRTVNVNDEFTAFSRFFVDPSRFVIFKDVAIEALNGQNFRVLLNRQIGSPIERISHRLYASRPAADVSRRLGIAPEQVCSIIEIAASLRGRDFVYFQELTVPPSDRRLELADPHSDDYVD
jgi:DNA-binding GntR family transcriptional regulator